VRGSTLRGKLARVTELFSALILVAFGAGVFFGRRRQVAPPTIPAPPPPVVVPPVPAIAAPRVVRPLPRRVAAPRHVGVSPPSVFVLQNDVNFNGVRIKAGKTISATLYDVPKLLAAGAKLAPAGDPGVEARALEVQGFQLKGHDPDMDVTSRFKSVDDPSDGDGVSNPMTSDLEAGGFGILDVSSLDFDEFDNGDSGSAATIDWGVANKQTIVLTADAVLTFVPPPGTANLMLHVQQDGVGGRVPSWDPAIEWTGAAGPPTFTTTPDGEDLVAFLWRKRASRFYGVLSPNFA
jgi:hypothetical protein